MSEFSDLLDTGMREFEDQAGDTAELDGDEIVGVFSEIKFEDVPELGGFSPNADATFTVRKTELASKPETGTKFEFNGKRFKVGDVTETIVSWNLNLTASAQ